VIFLGRSPAEEHLPGIIQAKECMKKKKHISEEQHYLCEIGLEKMPYGLLYQSYTEESLTHITSTAAPCKGQPDKHPLLGKRTKDHQSEVL